MRITTLAEYGVICALHLARRASEGPITGRDIELSPTGIEGELLLAPDRTLNARITLRAHGADPV